jgi:hypothetical protein
MKEYTIVSHHCKGIGVVVPSGSFLDKVSVVYDEDGDTVTTGQDPEELCFVGKFNPNIPNADPRKCGLGLGKACCRYLFQNQFYKYRCGRFTISRENLNMNADEGRQEYIGKPHHLYPKCQEEILASAEQEQ